MPQWRMHTLPNGRTLKALVVSSTYEYRKGFEAGVASTETIKMKDLTSKSLGATLATSAGETLFTNLPHIDADVVALAKALWAKNWWADANNNPQDFPAAVERLEEHMHDLKGDGVFDGHAEIEKRQMTMLMHATITGVLYGNW